MSTTVIARVTGSATATLALYVTNCGRCGVIFAITEELKDRRYADGRDFYCPNGHILRWSETEVQRQRKRAEQAESALKFTRVSRDSWRDQADAAERSARAYRGHLTRMKNKITAGVCPVGNCRRHFNDVQAHIKTQHKSWAHEHPEVLT